MRLKINGMGITFDRFVCQGDSVVCHINDINGSIIGQILIETYPDEIKEVSIKTLENKCKCSSQDLFNYGCKCGFKEHG